MKVVGETQLLVTNYKEEEVSLKGNNSAKNLFLQNLKYLFVDTHLGNFVSKFEVSSFKYATKPLKIANQLTKKGQQQQLVE